MNILLATYNYYPYNWGGSEVYVSGLANYLQKQGNKLNIIAGTPCDGQPVFYEDEELKSVQYVHEGITITGVSLLHTNTSDIYTKFRQSWTLAWDNLLKKLSEEKLDILHIHAYTPLISLSLVKAAKQHSPKIKILVSYHTPISCVKATLLFGNRIESCNVKPAVNICTACLISSRTNLPLAFTKLLSATMPVIKDVRFPTTIRLKHLVSAHLNSFKALSADVDQWHVFSEQIKNILILNKIAPLNIKLLRHGVNDVFLETKSTIVKRSAKPPIIFLYIGRFEKIKGFLTLLKAWCSLPETEERELWIVGEIQTEYDDIREMIGIAKQRKDIVWNGKKKQEEIAIIMQQSHCTIIPSEWVEIGPLVFHEAIATGNDVIASDIGGCRELAKVYAGKTVLFKAGSSQQLAKAIINFNYSNLTAHPVSQVDNYQQVWKSYQELVNRNILLN